MKRLHFLDSDEETLLLADPQTEHAQRDVSAPPWKIARLHANTDEAEESGEAVEHHECFCQLCTLD